MIQTGTYSVNEFQFLPLCRYYRSLQQRLYQHYSNLPQETTHYTDK
jgi:hypothetical protein